MSLMGRVMTLFPTFFYCNLLVCLWLLNQNFYLGSAFLLFTLYMLPVLVFRFVSIFFPLLPKNNSSLNAQIYSPWYGSYCIQRIYHDLPFLESILRSIPGAYSFWLRLWGAKIGKRVHWTPTLEILDRPLIDIGDNVLFGHAVRISSHIVDIEESELGAERNEKLILGRVTIGDDCFIGALSEIWPGSTISAKTKLGFRSVVKPQRQK
jgi:acetyltransferase-like isoleucine patch superfamily enzyme